MDSDGTSPQSPERDAVEHLRSSLKEGRPWPIAILEAMALWTTPQETYQGRQYTYFIGGEAFDWLLLAERLSQDVDGVIPEQELEELLFTGRWPGTIDESKLKRLLGVDKHRGYLNYFWGVIVEEALQSAIEHEVHKRHLSNSIQYQDDFSEKAFSKIYRAPRSELLKRFRKETGLRAKRSITLTESREFTYWLFKYRLSISDKAKVASDTQKGLQRLQRTKGSQDISVHIKVPR